MEREPAPATAAYDYLDVLVTLVEAYEEEVAKNEAGGELETVEVIHIHLERLGLSQAELARQAEEQPSHLWAVMNGRRSLSLEQIKRISAAFAIPPGRLIESGVRWEVAKSQNTEAQRR